MAARKITIYRLSPENPDERTELGRFELGDDDRVLASFKDPAFEWEVRQGLFDAEIHDLVTPADGARFMEVLGRTYGPKSFVEVEVG